MTSLDALIALVVGLAAVSGFRSGLVAGAWGLTAWGLGLLIADAAQARIAPLLAPSLGAFAMLAPALSFALALVIAEAALAVVGRLVIAPLRALVRKGRITGALDRLLGLVPGLARGLLVSAVALTAARAFPIDVNLREALDGSTVARLLVAAVDVARSVVRP